MLIRWFAGPALAVVVLVGCGQGSGTKSLPANTPATSKSTTGGLGGTGTNPGAKVDFHLSGAVNTNLVLRPYAVESCQLLNHEAELKCSFDATDPAKSHGYQVQFDIRPYSGPGTFDASKAARAGSSTASGDPSIVTIEELTGAGATNGTNVVDATAGQLVVERSSSLSGTQVGTAAGHVDADVPLSEGTVHLSGTWSVTLQNV
jgi:hypothetical protein